MGIHGGLAPYIQVMVDFSSFGSALLNLLCSNVTSLSGLPWPCTYRIMRITDGETRDNQ